MKLFYTTYPTKEKRKKKLEYELSLMGQYQEADTDDPSLFQVRRFEQSI